VGPTDPSPLDPMLVPELRSLVEALPHGQLDARLPPRVAAGAGVHLVPGFVDLPFSGSEME
jgi:hypothetical protein